MKRVLIVFLACILIFLIGCDKNNPTVKGAQGTNISAQSSECDSDADCSVGGCSGQICAPRGKAGQIVSTCEYRAEYDCLRLSDCSCVKGKCQWVNNQEYSNCVANNKEKGEVIV